MSITNKQWQDHLDRLWAEDRGKRNENWSRDFARKQNRSQKLRFWNKRFLKIPVWVWIIGLYLWWKNKN